MKSITIEEVLEFQDLPSELRRSVVSEEIIEGARFPLIFSMLFSQESMEGKDGRDFYFIKATQMAAFGITSSDETEPETTLDSGLTEATDKTITTLKVSITDLVYVYASLSDCLSEDYPSVDWTRLYLRNMGAAIGEYIEALIYTALAVASGVVTHSCASLAYGEIIDALAKMKDNYWLTDGDIVPYLVVAPSAEAAMLKDSDFVDTKRYTTKMLDNLMEGESGLYGGCRVFVHPYLNDKAYAFIIFPSGTKYGTVGLVLWKRPMRTKSQYEVETEQTKLVVSARLGFGIIQAKGICRITQTTTP